jgi:hypothetical protein
MSHPSQRGPRSAGHVRLQRELAQTLIDDRLRRADGYRLRREARGGSSPKADAHQSPSLLARLPRATATAVKLPMSLVRRARPRPSITASTVVRLDDQRGGGQR